jgi:hypothetical protein
LAKQTVNIGTVANDGTGDPIREAFDKVNDNFNELYSNAVIETSVTVGNSTVNSAITVAGIVSGNTTDNVVANTSEISINSDTAYSSLTKSSLIVSNTTVVNSTTVFIGNSTVNSSISTSSVQLSNSTVNSTLTRDAISVGNSTVNTSVNSTSVSTGTLYLTSNTLTLGSSSIAANGYTYLPNGLKMNFGTVDANSTAGQAVFSNAFSTNAYVVLVSSNTVGATYAPAVISYTNTSAEVRTANQNSSTVSFMAIGV